MGVLKELVTKIGFDIDMKPLEDLDKGLEAIKYGLITLAASAGGSVAAIYELSKSTAETREHMLKMAETAGMSIENFSKLAYAAKIDGVEIEEFGVAFTRLNRNLYEASQGTFTALKGFNALGISSNQLKASGYKTEEVLRLIAERMETMPSGFKKTALAAEIFGARSGARMIPFLNRMKEFQAIASEMGLGISKKQADESEEFMVHLNTMNIVIKGIKNTVANEFIPVVNRLIVQTTAWLRANKDVIKTNLTGFMRALGKYLEGVFYWGKLVATAFVDLIRLFGGAEIATKLFLGAIGILSGVALLYGVGQLAIGVWGLATAITAANLAAMAIPIAIGAAAAAAVLIIEDIASFFMGKKSLTGSIISWIGETGNNLIHGLASLLGSLADALAARTMQMLQPFMRIMDWIKTNERYLQDKIGAGAHAIADPIANGMNAAAGFLGMTPSSAPTSRSSNGSQNGNVSVQAPISVVVPPGTPPGMVAGAVSTGVSDGLESILRQTRNATANGALY